MAISVISVQSPQFDCNRNNQSAISAIRIKHLATCLSPYGGLGYVYVSCLISAILAIRLQSPQSDCNLHNQIAISAIRLQSLQSDCNLSNQTAISAIRLQSPQSMIRFYHVVPLGVHILECDKQPAHRFRLQYQQSDCNISNLTAI